MDIYIIKNSKLDKKTEDLLKYFQKKEILNHDLQKTHNFTYLMLDRIFENVYKINNREIIFENKKPCLKSKEKSFSISHSGEYIVIAVSDYNCGIDIEEMKERDFLKISKRMKFKSVDKENFYLDWTEYEAKYKLNDSFKSKKYLKFENYVLTALSINENEKYEIYFQNNGE